MDRRVAVKRYATAQKHRSPVLVGQSNLPQPWSRRTARDYRDVPAKDNQIIRGLIVGLPLAVALWLMLALLVWATF
jgi:hypothetical protein